MDIEVMEDGEKQFTIPNATPQEREEFVRVKEYLNNRGYKFCGNWENEALFATGAWLDNGPNSARRVIILLADAGLDEKGRHSDPFSCPRSMNGDVWCIVYVNPILEEGWSLGEVPAGADPDECDAIFETIHPSIDTALRFVDQLRLYI